MSPELALIDDELAKAAGAHSSRTRLDAAKAPEVRQSADDHSQQRRSRALLLGATALVALTPTALATAASPNLSAGSVRIEPSTARPRTPSPVIAWREVKSAQVYNVILQNGDRRVDFWSSDNELTLSPSDRRLEPGSYSWFVYAGVRDKSKVQYAELLAHGKVVVPPPP